MPLYPTSLVFVGISALLFAVTSLTHEEAQLLRLFPAYFLLSMLFNYAYATLEDIANGLREPAVPSVESLGPFELRPILQVALCAFVYEVIRRVGGMPGTAIAILALLLLPASVGVLGTSGRVLAAVNPFTVLRTALGLGWCYPVIVIVAMSYAAGVYALARPSIGHFTPFRDFAWFVLGELAVLSVFSLIGGSFFVRRRQLGFEPRHSPEKKAASAEQERLRLRSRMLDEMFISIRVRKSGESVGPLRAWLADTDAANLSQDTQAVMTQAMLWNSELGLTVVTRALISELIRRKRPDLAQNILDQVTRRQPAFTLESAEEKAILAQLAQPVRHRSP